MLCCEPEGTKMDDSANEQKGLLLEKCSEPKEEKRMARQWLSGAIALVLYSTATYGKWSNIKWHAKCSSAGPPLLMMW